MANIDNYLRQHKEIFEVVTNIRKLVNKDISVNSKEIAGLLNNLAGKLKVHLAMEDKNLYPNLIEKMTTKETALKFQKEMGGISGDFSLYKEKYNTAIKISENSTSFKKDTINLLNALEKRIAREEKELYILV